MNFEIRLATRGDVSAVRRIARKSWHAAYDDVIGPETVDTALENWYDAEGVTASVAYEDGRFLVAEREIAADATEDGGGVVGFAQGVLGDDGPARLARIYVHPEEWGEGVGTTLLGRIEAWLREAEVERLRLEVLADNEVGNAFYESRGYEVVEEREEELFDATVTECIREKEL